MELRDILELMETFKVECTSGYKPALRVSLMEGIIKGCEEEIKELKSNNPEIFEIEEIDKERNYIESIIDGKDEEKQELLDSVADLDEEIKELVKKDEALKLKKYNLENKR